MKTLFLAFSALVVFSVSTARAQFSIDWFTIDGGGGTSTGGVFSVTGTIGQPDAGTLTNGQYSVVGGFWGVVNVIQTPGAPLLSVEKLGGGTVRIFWPRPADGFVLDQALALSNAPPATVWTQVPFPYQTNATQISVNVAPSGNKFFRLRHL